MDDLLDYQTENEQDSLGVRDVLLIKCKSVIQDLHQEIADLNLENKDLEERVQQLEILLDDKDKQIRQSIYQNENIVDEFQNERAQVQLLQERNSELEKELIDYKQNEEGIIQQLEVLTITNNEMKTKVNELTQELEKRDHIAHEWHQTMQSVSVKISELDKENQQLTQERNQMLMSFEKLSPKNRFEQRGNNNLQFSTDQLRQSQSTQLNEWLQQTVDNLQNAIRDNEKKNQLIDQLQKENLNLKSNNMTLQRALEQSQHLHKQSQQNIINSSSSNNINYTNTNQINNRTSNNNNNNNQEANQYLPLNNSYIQQAINPAQNQNVQIHHEEIQNLQLQMNLIKQEYEEKDLENQKIIAENVQLKDKINILNKKYLNAELDSRKIDSNINNQVSQIEINKNNEITKYKELIQEQKELIQQLQNNEHVINQAKDIARLQQSNEFLNQRLVDCKAELNILQKDVINQFDKEDQRSIIAQQKLKQMEQIIQERDEIIKNQNIDIDQMKIIINQRSSSLNRSRQASRERSDSIKQEVAAKDEIDTHDRTLLSLMNENKSQSALIDSLQTQLKNEKITRIREQNAIQKMKMEVQNLEDQYNREITFYKTEFNRQMTEANVATHGVSNIQLSQQQLYTEQQTNNDLNEPEKKTKKSSKKEKTTLSSGKEGKSDTKIGSKVKIPKKKEKEKKKIDQSHSVIPSIIIKDNDVVTNQLGERTNSVQNIQSTHRIQQTPGQTQRINYNQAVNTLRNHESDSINYNNNNQYNYNTSNASSTIKNQPQLGYYRTVQQPSQFQVYQPPQQIKQSNEQNQDQIVDRFKHAINRIENKLERLTVDLKLHDSEEDEDDFKMSNYYQITK